MLRYIRSIPLNCELHMAVDDLGNALCYHSPGSGRAGFASCRRLGRSSVLETDRSHNCHTPRRSEAKPHGSLPDSGRERLWMRQKAARLMAFDPSTPDREAQRAPLEQIPADVGHRVYPAWRK